MIPQQTIEEFKPFAEGGQKAEPNQAKYEEGFLAGDVFPAEYANFLFNKSSVISTQTKEALESIEQEIINVLTAGGQTPTAEENQQLVNAIRYIIAAASSVSSVADKIVKRDANGRAQVAAPSADADITTKKYVDDGIAAAKNGANATGTLELAHGGTGANTSVDALKNIVDPNVNDYEEPISDSSTLVTYSSGVIFRRTFSKIKTWIKSWILKSDVGLGNVDNTADKNKVVKAVQDYNNTNPAPIQIGYAGPGVTQDNIQHFAVYTETGTKIKDAKPVEVLKKLAATTESRTDAWGDSSEVLGLGGGNGIYRRTALSLYTYIKNKILAAENTFTGGETFQSNGFGTGLIVNRNVSNGSSVIAFKTLGKTNGYIGVDDQGLPAAWNKDEKQMVFSYQADDNNFIAHTNEFNFIPAQYTGVVYFNWRSKNDTEATGMRGNVTEYRFMKGKGGADYSNIAAANIYSNGQLVATQNGNINRLGGVNSLAGEIYYSVSASFTFSASTGTFTLAGVKFYWRNEDVTTTISGMTKKIGKNIRLTADDYNVLVAVRGHGGVNKPYASLFAGEPVPLTSPVIIQQGYYTDIYFTGQPEDVKIWLLAKLI